MPFRMNMPVTALLRWLPGAMRALAAILLSIALGAFWVWSHGVDRRELLALPAEQRHALYEHALQSLVGFCARDDARAHASYCSRQAELAVLFPECDEACEGVAQSWLPRPTR